MTCWRCYRRLLRLLAVAAVATLILGVVIPLIELSLIMNGYADF